MMLPSSLPDQRGGRSGPGSRRYLLTVAVLPALVVVIGTAVALGLRGELPSVVASHWGSNGVDATQGFTAYVVTSAALILGLAVLLGVAGWVTPADGRRWMATLVAALAGLLGTLVYGLLVLQRGLTDPAAATAPPLLFAVAASVAAVLGVAAWAANPLQLLAGTARLAPPEDVPTVAAAPGEKLVWFGHAAEARWLGWLCAALVALACFCAITASPWAALGPAAGIVLVVLMARATVVVDDHGLRVTSAGALTWLKVPLQQVAHAETSSLSAGKDFGGLGMRYRRDARAFVTRTGEALLVVQQDGSRTYVSLDDAGEAAAVLNTLVRRAAVR